MTLTANILAADIHRRMVSDERFGYSWVERYGYLPEKWTVDNVPITIIVGDYDCSSSTITAWKLALKAFDVQNPLNGAVTTHNMKHYFTKSGLFEWRTDFENAKPGDLYLDEDTHVAMCQPSNYLSEFSSSETGGTTGQRGDQTGWESHITKYYRGKWDGYLHYIGTLTLEDIVTEQDKKDVARYVVNELLNTKLAVDGEKEKLPFWELISWTFRYIKEMYRGMKK